MNRLKPLILGALALALFEAAVFAAIAYRFWDRVFKGSLFFIPYLTFLRIFVEAYWWIPAVSIPVTIAAMALWRTRRT